MIYFISNVCGFGI